ncbi:MAG: NADH-quinone oxidoreductase subunit C [Bacteroidia bacterium]
MTKEELLNTVNQKLNEHVAGSVEHSEITYDFPVFTIAKDKIHNVLAFLKNDADLNFHFLTDLTGFQTADEKQLGVIYHLHNMPKNLRVRLKTFFPMTHPEIPTATDLWPGANWMERETYDFFGVKFKGHPNLKRILNMDEMDIFPMRKEYPLEDQSRDDKSDKMFGR